VDSSLSHVITSRVNDNRKIHTYLIKNLSEHVGTQLATFDGACKLLKVQFLVFVIVGGRTRKDRHFNAFLADDSPAKHDLSGKPRAQFARNGKIEACYPFK
jgi:hypothetical protein